MTSLTYGNGLVSFPGLPAAMGFVLVVLGAENAFTGVAFYGQKVQLAALLI